jgi:hypothetical protein
MVEKTETQMGCEKLKNQRTAPVGGSQSFLRETLKLLIFSVDTGMKVEIIRAEIRLRSSQ